MAAPARDAFSAWNDERDRGEDRVADAQRFVSPEMTGAERPRPLRPAGSRRPTTGRSGSRRAVPADWAPYSAGHWAWVRPWGWTWVDDAPWGFAPFHYGRWVYRTQRLVLGAGHLRRAAGVRAGARGLDRRPARRRLALGRRRPPVGWFPLAPHEVYVPSYRASPRYVREVNITHVTNVTSITTIVNNRNGEADRRDFANRAGRTR